ncbi:hypothetical protein EON68_01670, partial [archaeon]
MSRARVARVRAVNEDASCSPLSAAIAAGAWSPPPPESAGVHGDTLPVKPRTGVATRSVRTRHIHGALGDVAGEAASGAGRLRGTTAQPRARSVRPRAARSPHESQHGAHETADNMLNAVHDELMLAGRWEVAAPASRARRAPATSAPRSLPTSGAGTESASVPVPASAMTSRSSAPEKAREMSSRAACAGAELVSPAAAAAAAVVAAAAANAA